MLDPETQLEPLEIRREKAVRRLFRRLAKIDRSSMVHTGKPRWCFRCRRPIIWGDPYRIEVFYLRNDPVETRTHQLACPTYRNRPRLEASRARTIIISRGPVIKEIVMTEENEVPGAAEEGAVDERPRKKGGKAKKAKKEKKAKRSKEASETSEAPSAVVSIAEALKNIKGFDTKAVSKTMKQMAAGEVPSNKSMNVLKEHVKTEAARLREEKRTSDASKLSNINRHIRRVERSTR